MGDPFHTCLIGYPSIHWPDFVEFGFNESACVEIYSRWVKHRFNRSCCTPLKNTDNITSNRMARLMACLISQFNHTSSVSVQELELFGSFPPERGNVSLLYQQHNCSQLANDSKLTYANGSGVLFFGDPWLQWRERAGVSADGFLGYQNVSGESSHWNVTDDFDPVNTSGGQEFPLGYFLICGDRAWPGIPLRPVGGPCYIGKLTMFSPSQREIIQIQSNHSREKRSLHDLDPDCDPHVNLGTTAGTVVLSLFLPGASAGRNWKNIKALACWSIKAHNKTTQILAEMATDTYIPSTCSTTEQSCP